ncbi:MAG: hypothetical protein ABSF60_11080 [Verrucomicrobiota bacterium]|jgi:uncharacterized repeat protein (TIGR01451 family)
MNQKAIALALFAVVFAVPGAFGFESDNSSLTRSFNKTVALVNTQIVVTVNFTNGGTAVSHGFYYADQVPSGLAVSTLSLTVNGKAITNYLFESGQDGDVYVGCTPYRWVLEQPTNFAEANPIPVQAPVQIVYAITSSVSNAFNLQQFNWVGFETTGTNATFGYSETGDDQLVIFTSSGGGVSISGQDTTAGFMLLLNGTPGTNYVIEASTNLFNWVPLETNASPFQFTDLILSYATNTTLTISTNWDSHKHIYVYTTNTTTTVTTNSAGFSRRFYRGRLF